jgi:RimJ/RimL family protein N-acetyltransferase
MLQPIINWQPRILEDEILKLIPLTTNDFDALFLVAADPLIWEQHPIPSRYKKDEFQLYFDGAITAATSFLIIDKATETVIGCTRYYDYKPEFSSIAIGFTFLAKKYWGGQYNKSAKKLLLNYAFNYVDKVYFHIGIANIRSQKAIINIGATKVGEVDFDHYGKKLLHYEYVINKNEQKI